MLHYMFITRVSLNGMGIEPATLETCDKVNTYIVIVDK